MVKLSEAEEAALDFLKQHGGSVLTSKVPDTTTRDFMGQVEAGMNIYKKLERKGYVIITEEEPMEDGFVFTNSIELERDPRCSP